MAHAKKKIIAVVAGMAVFAAVSASAATLGGVTADSVGADSGAVTGPVSNGVSVAWEVEYAAGTGYVVSGATLTADDAAESLAGDAEVRITVLDEDGNAIGEITGTGASLGAPDTEIPVADVFGVDVVVNGN